MALATNTTVWEVRTTGSDLNGGGFNTARGGGGVDRSQQDAAQVFIDGVAITAVVQATTTDLLLTGYVVSAADLGNLLNITGGTATAGVYEIVSLPGGNVWRLDRSAGAAAQTVVGRMGGANGSPGWTAGKTADANIVYVKAGTYAITSTTANIAGGRVNAQRGVWIGYQTVRNDYGTAPVFQASGVNTFTLFSSNGNELQVGNIQVDGALQVATRGWQINNRVTLFACAALNCTNGGFVTASSIAVNFVACFAQGCTTASAGFDTTAGGAEPLLYACWVTACTVPGFILTSGRAFRCAAYLNTGATTDGFRLNQASVTNCVAYGNGRHGFSDGNGSDITLINCAAEGNAGFGYIASVAGSATSGETRISCAAFNNTLGNTSGVYRVDINFITGTSTFFVNPGAGDFTLTNTTTGGALLQGTGYPSVIGGTSMSINIGLGQAAANLGGGGGMAIIGPGAPGWVL